MHKTLWNYHWSGIRSAEPKRLPILLLRESRREILVQLQPLVNRSHCCRDIHAQSNYMPERSPDNEGNNMTIRPPRKQIFLLLRFLGGSTIALAVALVVFALIMRPPLAEFWAMTIFLGFTALVSLVAGYALYRSRWISRSPSLSWTLLSIYVLSSVLTFVNVWVTARLMFINEHDLTLATILLLLAAGIAMALGYFLSATLTRICSLGKEPVESRLETSIPASRSAAMMRFLSWPHRLMKWRYNWKPPLTNSANGSSSA